MSGSRAPLDKDAVRAANRLEEVIPALTGDSLARTGGRELVTRCPFHEDTHPSLRINIEKQIWRCDPCTIGGDVFTFVEKFHQETFAGALTRLADRAGLTNGDVQRAGSPTRASQPPARETTRPARWPQPSVLRFFDYPQPNGVLARKIRYDVDRVREKMRWIHSRDGEQTWFYGAGCDDPGLYGVDEAIALRHAKHTDAILVAEGERDARRLLDLGWPAVSPPHGAGLTMGDKWKAAYSDRLKAEGFARAYLFGDHDACGGCDLANGHGFNGDVARALTAVGIDARPVLWDTTEPEAFDVTDFLDRHGDVDGKRLITARIVAVRDGEPWHDPERLAGDDIDRARGDGGDEDIAMAFPAHATWPAPLSRAAYVGIFGDIVTELAPKTEADPAAILMHLLALFGNVIGRTAHFRVEADTHYLNLFIALVGATAKGRKGVAAAQAAGCFGSVDEPWVTQRHASGLSTGEGLISRVRDAREEQQPIKEGGRVTGYQTVIVDAGESDKRLFISEGEFASVLKVMMRDGNTLSPVIRNAWDGLTLRTLTRNSPLQATGPHISIVGSITDHEVRRYLQATECANGFGNRFLWTCVKRAHCLPYGGKNVNLDALAARLHELVRAARETGEMVHDRTAIDLWEAVYRPLSAGRPGLLGSITARAEAQVQRLACLFALGDGSTVVRAPHLHAALETWRYCLDSAAYIFGDSLGHTQADKLLAALKIAGALGLTRSEMTRDAFHNNIAGHALSEALQILQDAELVVGPYREADGLGRPSERWVYRPRLYERNELSPSNETSFVSFVGSSTSATPGSIPVPPDADAPAADDQPTDIFEVT